MFSSKQVLTCSFKPLVLLFRYSNLHGLKCLFLLFLNFENRPLSNRFP